MLRLRRHASPLLPPSAFVRSQALVPFMVEREWTHDAFWEISPPDFAAFREITLRMYRMCENVAKVALESDAHLDRFGVGAERSAMRRSFARGERPLVARLDFALAMVEPDCYLPRLLEINGDTAGNLTEGALLQREWGLATHHRTAGDEMEAQLQAALQRLPAPLRILHHPGDPYICAQSVYYESLVPGASRIEYPAVPDDSSGAVYKVFRWGRLWAGRFPEVFAWASARDSLIYEPAWAALLQHKALLADLWEAAPTDPHLLPATLLGPSALPNKKGWAHKSFHGVSGYEVVVAGPGEEPDPMPTGGLWQERVPPVQVDGLYPVLCGVVIDGEFAGAVMREDDTAISTDDIVVPIAIIES